MRFQPSGAVGTRPAGASGFVGEADSNVPPGKNPGFQGEPDHKPQDRDPGDAQIRGLAARTLRRNDKFSGAIDVRDVLSVIPGQ